MAVPVYPGSIPYVPLRDGYDVQQRHPALATTEMEAGPPRARPTSSSIWSLHTYQISMTEAEFAIFDAFVLKDLRQGSLRFYMPVGRFGQEMWPTKLVFIKDGEFTVKPFSDGGVVVSFALNVLDW